MTGTPAAQKSFIAGVFDRASGTYEQIGVAFFDVVGAALARVADVRPGDRVLDVGCGRGSSLLPVAAVVGPAGFVTGIDLAPGMVEAARAEIARRGVANAAVQVGDAEAPSFPDGSFDALLAGLVLFFLPDAGSAVTRYARLLRPGGRLALSTFTERSAAERSLLERIKAALTPFLPEPGGPPPSEPGAPPPEARLRSRESLVDVLSRGGFGQIAFTEQTVHVTLAGPEQYWDWMWSHGGRALLEQVPHGQTDAARAAFCAAVADRRGPDGTIRVDYGIRLTTAQAPTA